MAHSEDECQSRLTFRGVEFTCDKINKYHEGRHTCKGITRGWEMTWE